MIVVLGAIALVCGIAILAPIAHRHWRVWHAQRVMHRRFKTLIAEMQKPKSRDAWEALSKATPDQLAAAGAAYMRHEAAMYRIQSGLPPNYEDLD